MFTSKNACIHHKFPQTIHLDSLVICTFFLAVRHYINDVIQIASVPTFLVTNGFNSKQALGHNASF